MTSSIQTPATIKGGKLTFDDAARVTGWLGSQRDGRVVVTIKRDRPTRSQQQNRYYWGVVLALIAEETGDDAEAMHDAMRMMFLRDDSGRVPKIGRTSTLDIAAMEEYLAKIRQWASLELGVYIPDPNETAPVWG